MNRPRRVPVPVAPPPGLIVIGCSLGGLQALQVILKRLPKDFSVPIAVAQHRHRESSDIFPTVVGRYTHLHVCDVEDGDPVRAGNVYLAPADYHLLVEGNRFRLSVDERVHYSRPSIDVLFETAADSYRNRALGILLTGANADGAEGALAIRNAGGTVLVQDPDEAEAPVMPRAAIAAGAASHVLRLEMLADFLAGCCLPEDTEGKEDRKRGTRERSAG